MSTGKELLLHVCCGPDATIPWPELTDEGYHVTAFFYGGNIHPMDEFIRRLEAVQTVHANADGRLLSSVYAPEPWLSAVQGLEDEPEGGRRCFLCYGLQIRAAAQAAVELGIGRITTTLTISPHKDPNEINRVGRMEAEAAGLIWEDRIWRKKDGFLRSVRESRRLGIYRQNYCGCVYSMRERSEVHER